MRRCLACGGAFPGPAWACPACGFGPGTRGGFPAFAPEAPGSFDERGFAELAALEDSSFWFRSRNGVIADALRRHFPRAESLLEVGCGTGYVLAGLAAAFPRLALTGAEGSAAGLAHAARRAPGATLLQLDARRLPFAAEFDVVAAFDVLEHVEEDVAVLEQMRLAVRPGGGILLTVPHHPALWSRTDEAAGHLRRYRRRELREKVRRAGFRPLGDTAFVSLLLPALAASRLLRGGAPGPADLRAEHRAARRAGALLGGVAALERLLIRAGARFPAGGSLLLAAEAAP